MASNLVTRASNLVVLASNLLVMTFDFVGSCSFEPCFASNKPTSDGLQLVASASPRCDGLQPGCDGLQPTLTLTFRFSYLGVGVCFQFSTHFPSVCRCVRVLQNLVERSRQIKTKNDSDREQSRQMPFRLRLHQRTSSLKKSGRSWPGNTCIACQLSARAQTKGRSGCMYNPSV